MEYMGDGRAWRDLGPQAAFASWPNGAIPIARRMKMPEMITEHWGCLNCNDTGRVARFLFGKRKCTICDGKGERTFSYDATIPRETIVRLRHEGYYRFEPTITLADVLGFRFR